jgi:predicted RNase H-like nuclease (RuvC/YqgF family)
MVAVIERVDRLEQALADFVTNVGIEFNKLYNSQMRTEAELRAFKDEMRTFKDEMRMFKDEMRMFKDEMRTFKDEMRMFTEESRAQAREMNRKWGDVSNKLGTMVEDLVAPSLPRIVEDTLGGTVLDLMPRRKRRLADGRVKEFDAVALTADAIYLNSTKATLRSADVDRFVEDIAAFREFFPEYADLPLVGILASLAVDEGVLSYAEKQGFLVLAVGDELMEVKNRPGFEPKRW